MAIPLMAFPVTRSPSGSNRWSRPKALLRRADVDDLIDQIADTVLTHLSGMSARHAGPAQHRRDGDADQNRDRAEVCSKAADERNEPLDEQD